MQNTKANRSRGRPSTTDRTAVIETAMNAYWAQSPQTVSLNEICRLAKIAKPTLYRQFGHEDGLLQAVLTHYAGEVLGDIQAFLTSDQSYQTRLQSLINFICNAPPFANGCLVVKARGELANLGEQSRSTVREIESQGLQAYRKFFAEAREKGEWQSELSDAQAADYLHAQIGLGLNARAEGQSPEQVQQILDLALSVL